MFHIPSLRMRFRTSSISSLSSFSRPHSPSPYAHSPFIPTPSVPSLLCVRLPPASIVNRPSNAPRTRPLRSATHLTRLHDFDDRLRLVWRRCAEEGIAVPQVRRTGCRWVTGHGSWSDNPESGMGVGLGGRGVSGRRGEERIRQMNVELF